MMNPMILERKKKAVKKKFSIVIAGPTAVGKTPLAIQVAKWLDTEIISADSRQCYEELSIGVARPETEELNAVPHHFIASHTIFDEWNAVRYAKYALEILNRVFDDHSTAVVVGGTGLYIKALTDGLDALPSVDQDIRTEIRRQYEEYGLNWLQEAVKEKDPLYYASGEIMNPHRLMRALEIVTSTGKSIRSFQTGKTVTRPFTSIKIGLGLPREELVMRIDQRVDKMMEAGLLEEVKQLADLLDKKGIRPAEISSLQTVGYRELFAYLHHEFTLAEAVEKIKQHTRQYAKRQMTWFKKDHEFQWFHPSDIIGIKQYLESQMA